MKAQTATPREISYSTSATTRAGRTLIRSIENLTGRPRLIRMAADYEKEVAQGEDFWEVMQTRYGITFDIGDDQWANIPRTGPLVVVANHPFGILDGLAMGRILSATRGDFKIIANHVFRKAKDLEKVILPISFDDDREAVRQNVQSRKVALDYLKEGGAIGVFPGGTVSTSRRLFGRPMDPAWRPFTSKMVARTGATVVPIFFEGANSRLFQLVSHLHQTLRLALLIKEFGSRVDGPVRAVIGKPLSPSDIEAHRGDPRGLMDFLRLSTYSLSPSPIPDLGYGREFEEQWRT